MAVLPQSMEQLDLQDTAGSLKVLQDYIRYMAEQLEFTIGNLSKSQRVLEARTASNLSKAQQALEARIEAQEKRA